MDQYNIDACILMRGTFHTNFSFFFYDKVFFINIIIINDFIERYLSHLKLYVSNKAQPEGSIAEGYKLEETITFCSRLLERVETVFNRPA